MMRETIFVNQFGAVTTLTMSEQSNFMADGKYLFEVGGNRKTFNQIANLPSSYFAIDDIVISNRIPF